MEDTWQSKKKPNATIGAIRDYFEKMDELVKLTWKRNITFFWG
jgi:hypothetical protein